MSTTARLLRRAILSTALLACTLPALAQQAPAAAPVAAQGIEQQMTPEQFKAAGLQKLSPAELTQLNAWLNKTIVTETAKASVEAKKKVVEENRGFFNFGSVEPINSSIVGKFNGFAKGKQYTLANGQVWKQNDSAELGGVNKTDPVVKIEPSIVGNAWYMSIKGYNTRAKVERIK